MRNQHQKNLKIILSMEQKELQTWMEQLPADHIDYVRWLLEEVEIGLENIILERTEYKEAKEIIKKFTIDGKVD